MKSHRLVILFAVVSISFLVVTSVRAQESTDRSVADADGYIDLFAAGDFSLWTIDGVDDADRKRQTELWSIEDGIIAAAGKKYGFIRYNERVCDFSFRFEYRLPKGGNSGIGIRGAVYRGGGSRPSRSGYELQLLDDAGKPPRRHSSLSLYRYVAPRENPVLPAGRWNRVEITCQGPQIRIVANGKEVHDIDQQEVDGIKDKPLCGYLLLQNHGSPVEFRHVRLKRLDETASPASRVACQADGE